MENNKVENAEMSNALLTDLPDAQDSAIEAMRIAEAENMEQEQEKEQEKPKKRGRPKGSKAKTQKSKVFDASKEEKEKAEAERAEAESAFCARLASDMLETMAVTLVSDEWKMTDVEKEINVLNWQNTFNHYGGVKLSPPMALMGNYAMYIISRANQPKTKSKLGLLKAWVSYKWSNIFKKGDKNGTLPDNRTNNVRENDNSAEKSESK